MPNSRFTDNGDARIHYLDSGGDDRGAPVVFVPGMTCIAEDYAEILPLFGRRTVVIDLRGHGRSSAPATGYDAATLSTDVGAVVDAVTEGPVHVVTFSRGTTYALTWVLANVERVRSVAIGDYVPEEKVLTPEMSRRLLDGRWRGTPVRDRLDTARREQGVSRGAGAIIVGLPCPTATSAASCAQPRTLPRRRRAVVALPGVVPGRTPG